ncbi:P-loop NTPase fold protein [Persephonella sp. KM09-Lau-8]|uniref:P-loop NTPase fold protein n=1 Tax=Persephonella sp. KM09-Lau-8 TaxID=1158345 RepID=UPI00068D8A50|nr:P-loop NTPase fold protein [Persephonella sp. KM09-Lau-8]
MEQGKERNKNQISFLDDIPTEKDEIQLHSKIADSLLEIIKTIENNKKKVIGLFGSWGSGKSTVIKILESKLGKKEGNIEFLIFDSWSHQGDFLKRAFLLELAKKFGIQNEEHNLKNNNQKITIEKALTGKYLEKTIDPKIEIDWSSKVILSIILLAILIGSFNTIFNFFHSPFLYEIIPNWLLGFLTSDISTAVFILAIFMMLLIVIESISKTYFFKKSNINEVHSVKEDMEFMSHDYKKHFEEIIWKAKNKLENIEKFIIVFDNLDRVEDETLMNTLSLIQLTQETFEEIEKNNNQNEQIKNILGKFYFIIPIDRERLENTIKSSMPSEKDSQYAQDFIEKIIPYKTIIPDIYHNNWREFFNERIKEAVPKLSEPTINEIRLIFEKIATVDNLTPRKIKNFINDLVENYIFWKDEIDIRLQALFVAWFYYRKNKEEPSQNGKLPESPQEEDLKTLTLSNEYNQKNIEHILLKQYYKTNSVCDVLIEEMIKNIEDKNIQELEKLINVVKEKHKVENCIIRIWELKEKDYSSNINALLNLIHVIKETLGKSEDYKYIYENFWKNKWKSLLDNQLKNPEKIVDLKEKEILEKLIEKNEKLKQSFIDGTVKVIMAEVEEKKDDAIR